MGNVCAECIGKKKNDPTFADEIPSAFKDKKKELNAGGGITETVES